jgi:hypothetical protein
MIGILVNRIDTPSWKRRRQTTYDKPRSVLEYPVGPWTDSSVHLIQKMLH